MPGSISTRMAANSCGSFIAALRRRSRYPRADRQRSPRCRGRNAHRVRAFLPASWINANFDVWIGHREDVAAWNLLAAARDFYAAALAKRTRGDGDAPSASATRRRVRGAARGRGQRLVLVVRPRAFFRQRRRIRRLFRKLLSEVYRSLGAGAPDELAEPIKRQTGQRQIILPPAAFSMCAWMAANPTISSGWAPDCIRRRRATVPCTAACVCSSSCAMASSAEHLYLRVDVLGDVLARRGDPNFA